MKALIIVDVQKDFCPEGSLAVKNGDQVVPIINRMTKSKLFDLIIFTKDWHPYNMNAFASQHKGKSPFDSYINSYGDSDLYWPDHCVQNTEGAMFHQDLDLNIPNFYIFKKGMEVNSHPYSGFGDLAHNDSSGLLEFLIERDIDEVFIVGLATDFCVRDTAIDSARRGFTTYVVMDGVRAIAEDLNPTMDIFKNEGIITLFGDEWQNNDYKYDNVN